MPIQLLTGLPGHGKTLRMVSMLQDAAEKQERPIYVAGLDGLVDGPWTIIEDPTKWRDLPDGSLIFVDEAWKWFGHLHDARGAKTPKHVLDLAEHRHHGMDFVWTTQSPAQIYPFARTLIAEHTHVVRKLNSSACELYNWSELQEDVKSTTARQRAAVTYWMHPKKLFGMYKSASLHTMKPRIPKVVWALPVLGLIFAGLVYNAWSWQKARASSTVALGDQSSPALPGVTASAYGPLGATAAPSPVATLRQTDPLAYLRPRMPAMPWTAPAYDDAPIAEPPRLACISTDDRCTCYAVGNGQTVRWATDDELCRIIAKEGIYDPIRRESGSNHGNSQHAQAMPSAPTPAPQFVRTVQGGDPHIGPRYRSPDVRARH